MISHQLVPPGGWKFREEKTNTTIVARSMEELIKYVADHRRSNGITPGNVQLDIEEQLEKLHPSIVINKCR